MIRTLDPDFPFSLFHFAVHFSTPDMGGSGFEAADWTWFGRLVLRAAEQAPRVILPQVAVFLVFQPDSFQPQLDF
jgi:hypothetical protein